MRHCLKNKGKGRQGKERSSELPGVILHTCDPSIQDTVAAGAIGQDSLNYRGSSYRIDDETLSKAPFPQGGRSNDLLEDDIDFAPCSLWRRREHFHGEVTSPCKGLKP